jgi:hypothetical protein
MKAVMMAVALVSSALTVFGQVGTELIPNGDYTKLDEKGWVVGWPQPRNAKIMKDAEGARLVLTGTQAGVHFSIPLQEDWGQLKLSTQMRVIDVTPGKESWCTGRLTMSFVDANNQRVGEWPNVFGFTGTLDWQPCERLFTIPKGATRLQLSPINLGASGVVEFKAISLKLHRLRTKKENAPLPEGAEKPVWSLDNAWRETTPTRERISFNGLWGFRPVLTNDTPNHVPAANDCWGWIKVPGVWQNKWEGDQAVQRIWLAPWLEEHVANALDMEQAWYKRECTLPTSFAGKRVVLDFSMLQTHVKAFVDGVAVGELWYPGGELDITQAITPGKQQEIALLVTARPMSAETQSFMAPERIIKDKASVKLKGITGDLYLVATPKTQRIQDLQVITSTRDKQVLFAVETEGLAAGRYRVEAQVEGCGEKMRFQAEAVQLASNGVLRLQAPWKNPKLWDLHTPQNRYTATVTVRTEKGDIIDTFTPMKFGFREFRADQRNFILNDIPVHLRALHNTSMNSTADKACKASALEHCRRIQQYGFNFVIAGNYDFLPGGTSYLDGLMEACDETGVLLSFTLPHIKEFNFRLQDPATAARYRELAQWLIRRARNHPSVVFYAMNHNSTGYYGDQNPLKIDGLFEMPDASGKKNAWWENNRRQARITADIAKSLDPTRPVYHHQSGNLGDLHTVNIYLNWAPLQERSDWLEHWSTIGVKPLFFVEWGLPHISSWSSYRGPKFIWRCEAYQSLWASEFGAQFWGDAAYQPTPAAIAALTHEERLWAKGQEFTWSELNRPLRNVTNNYQDVQALFASDNWRSHRAWGISAMLPWDQGDFWKRVAPTPVRAMTNSLKNLKQPGIVPDHLTPDNQFINDTGDRNAFVPSSVGMAFLRWNMPDCAFIGGNKRFTDKRHLYNSDEKLEKTLVLLNDRREGQKIAWQVRLMQGETCLKKQSGSERVGPGAQKRVPLSIDLPKQAGDYQLAAIFTFEDNIVQHDAVALRIVPPAPYCTAITPLTLYDPKGLTAAHLKRLNIPFNMYQEGQLFKPGDKVVIGREALDEKSAVWVRELPTGVHLLVFEQQAKELYERLGFRIAERGSRQLFPRFMHPVTRGLDAVDLSNWRGSATLIPEHLQDLDEIETRDPGWKWCDHWNSRVWRCGNWGNVSSVLMEKPAKGDWRALVDGEFDLQYAPLLEKVEGTGRIIFCQLDVTGRSEPEPVADALTIKLVNDLQRAHVAAAQPVRVLGAEAKALCDSLGVKVAEASGILVTSSGAAAPGNLKQQVADGLRVLCLGMKSGEVNAWSPVPLSSVSTNAFFTRIEKLPAELNGLCNADWAWHGAMTFDAFAVSAENNQALKVIHHGKGCVIFWQVTPAMIDEIKRPYLRTSKRRANAMAARLLGNLGAAFEPSPTLYLDAPQNTDDPYRYYRW